MLFDANFCDLIQISLEFCILGSKSVFVQAIAWYGTEQGQAITWAYNEPVY